VQPHSGLKPPGRALRLLQPGDVFMGLNLLATFNHSRSICRANVLPAVQCVPPDQRIDMDEVEAPRELRFLIVAGSTIPHHRFRPLPPDRR
jgi:hypothetical protein